MAWGRTVTVGQDPPDNRQETRTVLPDWLARRAAINPQKLALVAGDLRWTFAELDRESDAIAVALANRGTRAGDRIALLLGNSAEFVAVVHGAPRLDAVLVPLNLRLAVPELAWQLSDVGARVLIYDSPRAARAGTLKTLVPGLETVAI